MISGEPGYFLALGLHTAAGARGVIAVKLSLVDFENAMRDSGEAVLLADRDGVVFLSAVPQWKYRVLEPLGALARERLKRTLQYGDQALLPLAMPARHGVSAQAVGNLGWRMLLLSDETAPRRAALAVGAAAALTAALAIGLVMHIDLRRRRRNERLAADARLREVHATLEQRIAARTAELEHKVAALKRTEAILRETRDSAVQAGKLAVLGQLSAGMSHELNQPLAALHTLSDNAIKLLGQGLGLGLALSLTIVESFGGRLVARNADGGGAEFSIWLEPA